MSAAKKNLIAPEIINSATPLEDRFLGVHPRLYAVEKDFINFRRLVKKEPYAALFERLMTQAESCRGKGKLSDFKGDVRGFGDDLANLAMAWKLTGDRRYFRQTRELLHAMADHKSWGADLIFGHFAHGAAMAWDWLYHDLVPREREQLAAIFVRHGEELFKEWADYNHFAAFCYTWNHMAVPLCGFTALACALFGEKKGMAAWMKMALEKARLMHDSLGPDGVSPEGIAYGQYHAEYLARTAILLKTLAGQDFISDNIWWRNYGRATLYHTYPRREWRNKEVFFMLGDAQRHHWLGPDPVLRLCAGLFHDGYTQWLADEMQRSRNVWNHGAFLNILWHDPKVRPRRPSDLPRWKHFDDQDIVFLRSGWDGRESVLAFRCGPHSGYHNLKYRQNVSGGHMHPMAGAIALYARGDFLLIESGYPRKMTAYENTLLVNGKGQVGEGGYWFEDLEFRRGHATPRMVSAGRGEGYDYAIGDATQAYAASLGLKKFVRHVYAVHPDCWFVLDEVEAKRPTSFKFLYHGSTPFRQAEDGAFLQVGERGTLSIQPLFPNTAKSRATIQKLQWIDGGKPYKFIDKGLVEIMPSSKTRKAVIITFLHAFPTGGAPQACASVKYSGKRLRLTLKRKGRALSWDCLLARYPSSPALFPIRA